MPPKVTSRSTGIKDVQREQRAAEPSAEQYDQLKQDLLAAIAPGRGRSHWLSQAEAKGLIARAHAAGPDVVDKLKDELAGGLKRGEIDGHALVLGDAALQELANFAEVPAGTYRAVVHAKDGAAEHELAGGMPKAKQSVSDAQAQATRKQLAFGSSRGGKALTTKQLTPAYQAAMLLGGELTNALDAHLAENHPEAKQAADAMSPHVTRMVRETASRLEKDPEAMARLTNVIASVGQEGFAQAVADAAPEIGKAFTEATGIQAMNPEVVAALLDGLPKLAAKLAPETGAKLAKTCAGIGAKLGVETAAQKVVEKGAEEVAKKVAKKGAKKAAEKVAEKGAEKVAEKVTEKVVEEGAEAAVKGAATAGKAVPGLGNAIALSSALLAGTRLIKTLFSKGASGEQKAKEGINTLMQSVGVAFPWVGLAGDLIDVGWSAKMASGDKGKDGTAVQGDEPKFDGVSKEEAAPLISDPARLLASVLEGAGQGDAAGKLRHLADTTEAVADRKVIESSQLGALSALSNVAATETKRAADDEPVPENREALDTLAHGFGELFSVLYRHNKLKGQDGDKRDELKADLMRITGDVALASAVLATGKRPPESDQ